MNKDLIKLNTEFSEKFEIEGQGISWDTLKFATGDKMLGEELKEVITAIDNKDIAETLDGFGDVAVIALNGVYKTLRMLGNDPYVSAEKTSRVFELIIESNLAKLHDGLVVRDTNTGKVVKPTDWEAPNFNDIIGE